MKMDKYLDKVLCADCRSIQPYDIRTEKCRREWNGIEYTFNKRIAICRRCGNRVTVPGMDDINENEFETKCREENDYILVDEIKDIMQKYDVEKRPLSKVLGLGEHTIEHYLSGQLPSKRYSEMLKRVLVNYQYMQKLFAENKENINERTANKIETRLRYYDLINSHGSLIESVALYVLNSKYEITNMSLQKLLYYIEAFCQILLNERIFENRCEAWAYGPVYPEIYDKYKSFEGRRIIVDKADLSAEIDNKYRDVIDYVISNFAIYNGVTLKDLSHAELPWRKAHEGYGQKERCEEEITHESITEYFMMVHKKYDLSKESGVKKYIASLGVM